MRSVIFGLAAVALLSGAAAAQATLPVGGTMAWNLIAYDGHLDGGQGAATRFSGRLTVPLHPRVALGAGVGSWARNSLLEGYDPDALTSRQEALVYQAFAQLYPLAGAPVFARIGVGVADSESFTPAGGFIDYARSRHPALALGAGWDLRLTRPLWLTLALDHVRLTGTDPELREIRSGTSVSIGLTLR